MTSVFDTGPIRGHGRQPSAAEQLTAFRNRAFMDGDWAVFRDVVRAERDEADARRARTRAHVDRLASLPRELLIAVALTCTAIGLLLAWWLATHPLALAVSAGAAGAALALRVWLWWQSRRALPVLPLAPAAAITTTNSHPAALEMQLTGTARALVDGLSSARRRLYLEALGRGMIGAPEQIEAPHGCLIRAELPGGQVAPEDIDCARMAQTLGLHADQVHRVTDAPAGVLAVEVLNVRPRDLAAGTWPHLGQAADFSTPVQIGVEDHGRAVNVDLASRRLLVVGQSGSGKTRFMRAMALYALADPRVRLSLIDLKGSPALLELEQHTEFFHVGQPDTRLREHLSAIRDEVRDRYTAYRRGEDVAARGWIVVVVDEGQMLWRASWALDLMEEIAKTGREVFVGVMFGTQLADSKSLPTAVLGQFDVRLMLRAPEAWMHQMVLSRSVDGGSLPAGHGYLWDNGDVARVVTHHVTDTDAATHLAALTPAPLTATPTTLHLVDDTPTIPELLATVRDVIGHRAGAGWAELAGPCGYRPDEVPDLQADLRAYGIRSASYRDELGGVTRGVSRTSLEAAIKAS